MQQLDEPGEKPAGETARPESGQRILSMSPDKQRDLGAAILERMDSIAQAIRDKDIAALMNHYAPDVVVYDVLPPLDVHGADGYRKNFERWFAAVQGPIDYEMQDLSITAADTHAFCHCLSHVKAKQGGEYMDYWVRVTSGFEPRDGQWLVTHEHISMPAKM